MAFGQPSGPPATHRQIQDLLALLQQAGHTDFRDARGPMSFTQRQAGGKFTRDEADAYIAELMAEAEAADDSAGPGVGPASSRGASKTAPQRPGRGPVTAAERTAATQTKAVRSMSSEVLAAELQRRGWAVMEP